jgi:hypothetical protein
VSKKPAFAAEKPDDLLPFLRYPLHRGPSKCADTFHPPLPSVIRFAVFAVGRSVCREAATTRSFATLLRTVFT